VANLNERASSDYENDIEYIFIGTTAWCWDSSAKNRKHLQRVNKCGQKALGGVAG
jgi:hypothetical protein